MILLKKEKEIEILKEGGKILSEILKKVKKKAKPQVSTLFLSNFAFSLIKEAGAKPSFLNFKPEFAKKPFPAPICISVNEVVVHGIPKKDLILKEGDLVSLDCGICYKNLYTDMAITFGIGKISLKAKRLIKATKEALKRAIKLCRPGKRIGDISFEIESTIRKYHFYPICELSGHGVGYQVHEDPYVPNCGFKNTGELLKEGLVIAIEPMAAIGTSEVICDEDEQFLTADGSLSSHFEATVAVTKKGPMILTPLID